MMQQIGSALLKTLARILKQQDAKFADVLIVQKALESSDVQDTMLVGDDTNLLVIAIYHSRNSKNKLKTKKECKTTNFGYQQSEKGHGHVQLQAYCFSMPFSVAIQLLGRLGLEKVQS